eukprot:COSAG02_NODE_3246_length_7100_cov_48.497072_4_plen_54_part_00
MLRMLTQMVLFVLAGACVNTAAASASASAAVAAAGVALLSVFIRSPASPAAPG